MLDVVILAAGKGTRMKSSLPKVLQLLAGKPMLSHVVETASKLPDFEGKPVVVVGHGSEQVIESYRDRPLSFVHQREQLGTGHAVMQALDEISENASTLILYGDVPLISVETLTSLIKQTEEGEIGLLTVNLEDPTGYGRILRDDQGAVTGIIEQKDASPEQLTIKEVNTGILLVPNSKLREWLPSLSSDNAQQEYYLTDVISLARQQNVAINTAQPKDPIEVQGVNDRRQQAQLEREFQLQQVDRYLFDGLCVLDPQRFDCRGHLSFGNDVSIDINCIFEGEVTLGDNVSIGPNCCLKNTTVASNSTIKANSVLEDSEIGQFCDIGPYARVRPGTVLADNARLGNFVETKKALIGKGSKVNHLSYVGDAELGDNVNVGAGTITCNYDGVNKSKTTIGDEAFIGSNSSLVAPVSVGDGATVAAGSTITSDVDGGSLGVARGKQRNIAKWSRPVKKNKE